MGALFKYTYFYQCCHGRKVGYTKFLPPLIKYRLLHVFVFLLSNFWCRGQQQKYASTLPADTAIDYGVNLHLMVDTIIQYNHFLLTAKNPRSGKFTIWGARNSDAYHDLFNDSYNRLHPVVNSDRDKIIYIRYRTPAPNAMQHQKLDSAWLCTSAINGTKEEILLLIPDFHKNAVYDLDWSNDEKTVLLSIGNDAYPTLTRDGDVFEYEIHTGILKNVTNEWALWNNYGHYVRDGNSFAYTHAANYTSQLPTDIFVMPSDGFRRQVTTSAIHEEAKQFCTLTFAGSNQLLYRRGDRKSNALYQSVSGKETLVIPESGFGGIQLANGLFAGYSMGNHIELYKNGAIVASFKVSEVRNFRSDDEYNPTGNLNIHLVFLGKLPMRVEWSTGATSTAINITPIKSQTIHYKITFNEDEYRDSIYVHVRNQPAKIQKECNTLRVNGYLAYQWLLDDSPIDGATSTSFTPYKPGRYSVRGMDKKGTMVVSAPYVYEDNDLDKNDVELLPDATTNTINIKSIQPVNAIVVNESGKIVLELTRAKQIGMNSLPDGSYEIKIITNECLQIKSKHIVKRSN